MPLIETLTLFLAPAVGKSILKFWLKGTWAEGVPDGIVDLLKKKTEDVLAQQKGKRQFEAIGEKVVESLIPLFESERVTFSEPRKEEIASIITKTLNRAHLTTEILTERNLEPKMLADHLLTFQPDDTKDFSESEREFYRRAISEISRSIVDIASRLPNFTERTLAEILKRETQLISIANDILDEVRRIREQSQQVNVALAAAKFEEDYRLTVIRKLDELQLFGVDVSKASGRQKLSVAYVTLSVEQLSQSSQPQMLASDRPEAEETDEDEEDNRIIMPIDQVLANAQRLLIRGNAGSGKTTLMQWIAVRSAGKNFEGDLASWNNTTPFYVRLRQYVESELPAPEDLPKLIAPTIAAEMPPRWVHEKLRSGTAILLIDGVDELHEMQRHQVRVWISSPISARCLTSPI